MAEYGRHHDEIASGWEKTGANFTDRGKRGFKRSLLTEAQGIPVGLVVDGADRHDMKLVRATVESVAVPRPAPSPQHPQGMCLDKGFDFDEVRRTLAKFVFTAHIRSVNYGLALTHLLRD